MALYVDDADLALVGPALATGLVSGVTTNPSVLARAGLDQRDVPDLVASVKAAGARRVFLQTLGLDAGEIYRHGRELRALEETVVVKVPATRAGFTAAARLCRDGVPVLVTAVYAPAQAVVAAEVGAAYIAPYVGRMSRLDLDGVASTIAMAAILTGTPTRILAASLPSVEVVGHLAAAGIEDFTLAPALLDALLDNEHSLSAARDFEAAAGRP